MWRRCDWTGDAVRGGGQLLWIALHRWRGNGGRAVCRVVVKRIQARLDGARGPFSSHGNRSSGTRGVLPLGIFSHSDTVACPKQGHRHASHVGAADSVPGFSAPAQIWLRHKEGSLEMVVQPTLCILTTKLPHVGWFTWFVQRRGSEGSKLAAEKTFKLLVHRAHCTLPQL